MPCSMNTRDEFMRTVRRALGRPGASAPILPVEQAALSRDRRSVEEVVRSVRALMEAEADRLLAELEVSAARIGWTVAKVSSPAEAAGYIASLARDLEARSLVRTAHPVLNGLNLEESLPPGIGLEIMAEEEGLDEAQRRRRTIAADLGVTGADYAVAETGTCVLLAGRGASRLVSLLPPVHVAVVKRGQVLPGLDELFALLLGDFLKGGLAGHVNLVSGPSRSADIESVLVTGVHGPGEVHMVLLD